MATQNKGFVVVSPASRSPADELAQQVRGQIRACQATVLGKAAILSFYKLKPPYCEGEKDPSEILKATPEKTPNFRVLAYLLCFWGVLFSPFFCVPTVSVCFLTSAKSLSSTSDFVC